MKKGSIQEEFQKRIMDHGVAHLVYYHNGVQDLLHPFSIEGYELLSDDFFSFLDKYRPLIPEKVPIALEIVGKHLTEEEKDRVDRTIWTHFCIVMAQNSREVKKIGKTSLWYLLFTLLSTALVLAVSNQANEVISNLAYLPFYFFGYRMLIYILIDSMPVWKQRRWCRRLASVKLIFSDRESRSFENLDPDQVSEEFTRYEKEAEKLTRKEQFLTEYFFENGTAVLGCKVSSLEDVIRVPQLSGREYTSDAFSTYLNQAEPFLNGSIPVLLHISGTRFDEEEREVILRAIKNYYGLRIVSQEENRMTNGKKILVFGFFTLLSAIALALCGGLVDAGTHEFIVMLLCFFGDYLMEFILITHYGIWEDTKKLEQMRGMKVVFEQESLQPEEHDGGSSRE